MKKIGMIVVSAVLVFGMTACGGEKEQPQAIQQKEEQQEQSEKIKRLEEEKNGPSNYMTGKKQILERFPELQQIQDYLFANYPTLNKELQEKAEEREKRPIEFYYKTGKGEAGHLTIGLNFNESVTKKEMISAIKYVHKELMNLFSDYPDIDFWFLAHIVYTTDWIEIDDYNNKRGRIEARYNQSEGDTKLTWKEVVDPKAYGEYKFRELNPDEVKPDEVVAYFKEQESPAPVEKTSGIRIDEIIEMLKKNEADYGMNVEEFSREKEEETKHVISKGGNKEGSYTFEITANEYERAISGIYKVKRLSEMSDEAFKKECMTYLRRAATSQYTSAVKVSVYRYMGEVIEYIMTGEEPRTEFMAENTKFEIVSEEEGNCIAVYVTSYAEKYEQ